MPNHTPPSHADVVFNRANVALARSQLLVQSWLPARSSQDTVHSKTEQELLNDDDELFRPTPELLGVGATAPNADQDPLLRKTSAANNDRLLEKLLGKKAARGHRASSKPQPVQNPSVVPQKSTHAVDLDDDQEEGRATMVASSSASKRKAPIRSSSHKAAAMSQSNDKAQPAEPLSEDDEDSRPTKKRPGTYLDQLLAEKASKKKRKQQQKN